MRAWLKEHKGIVIILLVAFALRFWNFWKLPFTHDELSALLRTRITGWQEFIDIGIKMDNHPGGVQLLIWFQTILGGYEMWWIKLPFLLAGTWCVWLIYLIGKRLFSISAGILSAAFMASLQFPISFSQWARPYIIGLLVILALTWVLTRLLYERKSPWKWIVGFVLLVAISGYVHYFALLQAIIVSLGFFILFDRDKRLKLLLGGVLAALLWLPHLSLTLFHLDRGGIGNWLKAPPADYWQHMLAYIFQFSWWPILLTAIAIVPNIMKWKKWIANTDRWMLVAAFVLPYIIGYVYSVQRAPLLHQSVLIFSLPFLLLWLTSFANVRPGRLAFFAGLLMAINAFMLINQRQHYVLNYDSEYGSALNWLAALQSENPEIDNVIDLRVDFVQLMQETELTEANNVHYLEPLVAGHTLEAYLNTLKSNRIFFAMNVGTDPEAFAAVLHHYPCIEKAQYYHAGEAYLLSKECDSRVDLRLNIRDEEVLTEANPYSTAMYLKWDELSAKSNTHFVLEYAGNVEEANSVVEVSSVENPMWRGVNVKDFFDPNANRQHAYHVLYNSEMEYAKDDELKSFIWLSKGDSLHIKSYRAFRVPMNTNKFRMFYE